MEYEIWKDIPGYEGLYKINNYGIIKNNKGNIRKQTIDKNGYCRIILSKKRINKNYLIHRLVAQVFIDNPNNYPIINHKDENKQNNCVNNLEWCTIKYNCNYGTRIKRIAEKNKIIKKGKHFSLSTEFKKGDNQKKVICIELNKVFDSIKEAGKMLDICSSNITNCCKHKKYNKTAKGYHFEYYEGDIL